MGTTMKKSTLIKLGLVAAALVMIPRRSSQKSGCMTGCGCPHKEEATDKETKNASEDNSANKTSACPLCKTGNCPFCRIAKGFCCKKSNKAETTK